MSVKKFNRGVNAALGRLTKTTGAGWHTIQSSINTTIVRDFCFLANQLTARHRPFALWCDPSCQAFLEFGRYFITGAQYWRPFCDNPPAGWHSTQSSENSVLAFSSRRRVCTNGKLTISCRGSPCSHTGTLLAVAHFSLLTHARALPIHLYVWYVFTNQSLEQKSAIGDPGATKANEPIAREEVSEVERDRLGLDSYTDDVTGQARTRPKICSTCFAPPGSVRCCSVADGSRCFLLDYSALVLPLNLFRANLSCSALSYGWHAFLLLYFICFK